MTSKTVLRWGLYGILILFALFYLKPLFVMLDDIAEIPRGDPLGSLLALPREITFAPWAEAGHPPAPAPSARACARSSGTAS